MVEIGILFREGSNLIKGESKVAGMEDKLERIQAFIDDAERVAEAEGDIKTRVKELKEAYFRLEDAMDECMIREQQQPRDPGCEALLCGALDFIKTLMLRLRIDHENQVIESSVREIKERGGSLIHSYSEDQGPSTLQNLGQAPLYMDQAENLSFGDESDELITWLVTGGVERTVFSVVGMGGLGKTTLARKVYHSQKVVQHFDCHAWITIPQSYTMEGLLRDMLQQFTPYDVLRMDLPSLIHAVSNCLKQKRYVIVFDDVWDTGLWDTIQFVAIDNKNGSRVLVTTRDRDVALSCRKFSRVQVLELRPLTFEQSLDLFYKTACRNDFDRGCPEELKYISYDIVKKCGGLPLAIVTVAGVLSYKERNTLEWFSQNLSSRLENDVNPIVAIIGLSYDDLPYNLKTCLLYLGLYPQDNEIKSKRLIRQWIAEGFIKREDGKTLEEVGQGYLTQLIYRNLLQVSSFSIDGRAKGCRFNGLVYQMILSRNEYGDGSFSQCITEGGTPYLNEKTRRLSIQTIPNDLKSIPEGSLVRSLLFFIENRLSESLLRLILSKYKLLKVLDFENANARLSCFPENLGDLILLKYLSLRNTGIQSLPKSIGNLHNLETLDLRQTYVNEMLKEVSNLTKLRHLLGNRMPWTQLKDGIGGMTSLQTLSEVQIDDDEVEPIRELGELKMMRKLSLIDVREEQVSHLLSSINEMRHLEKLYIEAKSKDAAIDLRFVSYRPLLRKLRLKAKLSKLPEWIPRLPNLVELSLSYSKLIDDPLQPLKDLPNLFRLNLANDSYEGESLHFQEGGFWRLKELGLRYLPKLNSITIGQGALRSLKELRLMSIPQLKTAPEGIQYLAKLEVLNMHFMPNEFTQSMKELTKDMNLRK